MLSTTIKIPKSVRIQIKKELNFWIVWVFGPLGISKKKLYIENISQNLANNTLVLESCSKKNLLTNKALFNNLLLGQFKKFKREVSLVGVGLRATKQGEFLDFSLGYSHNILIKIPTTVSVFFKKTNKELFLFSSNLQTLNSFCEQLLSLKKENAYTGKGIKFLGDNKKLKKSKKLK